MSKSLWTKRNEESWFALSANRGRFITVVFAMQTQKKRLSTTLEKNDFKKVLYKCCLLICFSIMQKPVRLTASSSLLLTILVIFQFRHITSAKNINPWYHFQQAHQIISSNAIKLSLKIAPYKLYDLHLTNSGHQRIGGNDVAELQTRHFRKSPQ